MDITKLFTAELVFSLIKAVGVLLLTVILVSILKFFRRKIDAKLIRSTLLSDQTTQIRTLIMVVDYILRIVIIFLGTTWILAIFGVNIVPLLTTVGLASLGVTLAAQSVLKDYISGILILLEKIFLVGDTITVDIRTGTIEKITLRITYLIDADGRQIIIPNGEIRTVTKGIASFSQFLLEFNLPISTDILTTTKTLETLFLKWHENEQLNSLLTDIPKVIDSSSYNQWAVKIRCQAKAKPENRSKAAIALRDFIKSALEENKIQLISDQIIS